MAVRLERDAHQIAAGDTHGQTGRASRHDKSKRASVRCLDDGGVDPDVQTIRQTALGLVEVRERGRAHDPARRLVGHAQHDAAAAVVGEGAAIVGELIEIVVGFASLNSTRSVSLSSSKACWRSSSLRMII
jgi:hypothetical protein